MKTKKGHSRIIFSLKLVKAGISLEDIPQGEKIFKLWEEA